MSTSRPGGQAIVPEGASTPPNGTRSSGTFVAPYSRRWGLPGTRAKTPEATSRLFKASNAAQPSTNTMTSMSRVARVVGSPNT